MAGLPGGSEAPALRPASPPASLAAAPATPVLDPSSKAHAPGAAQVAMPAPAMSARSSGPPPPERGNLLQERFQATQEWLRDAPGDHFAIQLAIANSNELQPLEDFLLEASKVLSKDELFVYSVIIDGQQHYRVAYGNYANPAQARSAIDKLPSMFNAYRPYYRSVERMRSQNRQ